MNKLMMGAAAVLLAACGFHLKGSAPYDRLPYQNWHISGGEVQQELENALIRAKGRPSESGSAQATLVVEAVSTQRDVLTVTRAALINEYALVLNVRAQAYQNGKPLGGVMNVSVRRTMDYADSQVLGKQEEEARIWQEMRRDAADQLVRRLAFVKAQ